MTQGKKATVHKVDLHVYTSRYRFRWCSSPRRKIDLHLHTLRMQRCQQNKPSTIY